MSEQIAHPLFPQLTEGLIRRILKARRARARFLTADLFSDPAWDILLELYASELGQRRINIGTLTDASGVPSTTALRWIRKLEEEGLVRRDEVVNDRRQVWVSLTSAGAAAMQSYFASLSATPITL
jgi:DNA-binding MarR family transcriptional regulator